MKFGVREICNVVLKAKAAQKVGNKIFYKNEPVLYFDTLKTSSMEGAATTVYAQGGRGNARLVAWEGERTVTFTMEDALISPEGFMILSGAGLIEASANKPIYQHIVETTDDIEVDGTTLKIWVEKQPYLPIDKKENFAYVMIMKNGEAASEPYIPVHNESEPEADEEHDGKYLITVIAAHDDYVAGEDAETTYTLSENAETEFANIESVLVDYYVEKVDGAKQIEITADKFGGNYYLEASTLFRNQDGVDLPAEFIIPNCKIQSNFTFTMASSGDPSTFTFTMDAFPDYTRFDKSKKVLAAIQIIDTAGSMDIHRIQTDHVVEHEALFE
jgi:hypothetical protein